MRENRLTSCGTSCASCGTTSGSTGTSTSTSNSGLDLGLGYIGHEEVLGDDAADFVVLSVTGVTSASWVTDLVNLVS